MKAEISIPSGVQKRRATKQNSTLFTWKPLVNNTLMEAPTTYKEGQEWGNALYDTFVTRTPNLELKKTALNYGNLLFNDTCPAASDSHWIKIKAVGNKLLDLLEQEGVYSSVQRDFKDSIKATVNESAEILAEKTDQLQVTKKRKFNA